MSGKLKWSRSTKGSKEYRAESDVILAGMPETFTYKLITDPEIVLKIRASWGPKLKKTFKTKKKALKFAQKIADDCFRDVV